MANVVPPTPRARQTENGDALCVVVPARSHWFALAFLPVWLAGWTSGGLVGFVWLVTGKIDGFGVQFVFVVFGGLIAWTAAGASGLFLWLWNAVGREEIIVDSIGDLSVRYAVYDLGKTWEFDRAALRNLRVSENGDPFWVRYFWGESGTNRLGIWNGPLAFDYGAKTYRFGAGMDEAEARDVLPHLLRRLSPDDPTPNTAHSVAH